MKQILRSYTGFSRTERMGIIGLSLLLVVLIAFLAIMHFWIDPRPVPIAFTAGKQMNGSLKTNAEGQQLSEAISLSPLENSPKRQQLTEAISLSPLENSSKRQQTATNSPEQAAASPIHPFDPNTADSLTLVHTGMRPAVVRNLLRWRAKGKHFYRKEDLKPLYTLTETEYNRLEPYIAIPRHTINLNTADSVALVGLPGIGPKLAHRIIARRGTQGPFTTYQQLLEIYPFADSTFAVLKEQLVIQ